MRSSLGEADGIEGSSQDSSEVGFEVELKFCSIETRGQGKLGG